jgi:K(+)-stimulated pyrophosphate-energized sodium pump
MLFSLVVSLLALIVAGYLAKDVLAQDSGSAAMRRVADAIREGAEAFLRRQYRTIGLMTLGLALLIGGVSGMWHGWEQSLRTTFAFLLGAGCSALSGYIGMGIAIRANVRTAQAACTSLGRALVTALRGGAVSGITVVALSLLGIGGLYYLYGGLQQPQRVPFLLVGYGFGASFVALFAQLGGGIYTKAADVGADLVGDNVGDCAGRGADLFESTAAENIGAMILGVALYPAFGVNGIVFPLVARAIGLLASIVGILTVRERAGEPPMRALHRGYYVATSAATLGLFVATWHLLGNLWFFAAGLIGIVTSLLFVYITQYYTEARFAPGRAIVQSSQTGPATNIITGFAVAFECTALPTLAIAVALLASYYCGVWSGVADAQGQPIGGLYGTALATMGMLAPCAYILAMDAFGPITDNAGGIIAMSGAAASVRQQTDELDAVGTTTKALTKGYAMGSAALAAFLLFSAYMDEVGALTGQLFAVVNLANLQVFIGALLGAMLVFLFSALAIRAVGRAAAYVIAEVRRQFREQPGIMRGERRPEYAHCVDIVTAGALKEMIPPGLLAVGMPVVVGLLLGAEAVAALLMAGTILGILLATAMNNGGGAWDNAKKAIEGGLHGGKGSAAHKAAVVGDTVGDPFKDTAGPSLHVLIKLLSTVTLVLAGLFV